MNWDAIVPLVDKIGLVAAVIVAGYLISKLVARFLVDVTVWSNADSKASNGDPDPQDSEDDPAYNAPGLHVFSAFENEPKLVVKAPTEDIIRATIRGLDWAEGFHHVWLVTSPGVSLEVSGCLDPDYGLSSAYRDLNNDIIRVINEPPSSVRHIEDLLVSFHLGDRQWEERNVYE